MLSTVHPKLPSRNLKITKDFYLDKLKFQQFGDEYPDYLMLYRDNIEVHFFEFRDLSITENYGMIYIRTNEIEKLYEEFKTNGVSIHPNGPLTLKPWGMKEFSILDPDMNLLTFGENK